MITRIRGLIARTLALAIVLCTFGLVRVDWAGGTVEHEREREGRSAVMIVDDSITTPPSARDHEP